MEEVESGSSSSGEERKKESSWDTVEYFSSQRYTPAAAVKEGTRGGAVEGGPTLEIVDRDGGE